LVWHHVIKPGQSVLRVHRPANSAANQSATATSSRCGVGEFIVCLDLFQSRGEFAKFTTGMLIGKQSRRLVESKCRPSHASSCHSGQPA